MAIEVSQTSKSYSFDSVGEMPEQIQARNTVSEEALPPIGIKTPIELEEDRSDFLVMHRTIAKQIRDNFRNMLATNHGERLMIGDFGANLLPLAWELNSEGGINSALRRIKETTQKYMPYVELETFEPLVLQNEDKSLAKTGVRISYSVPSANLSNQVVEAIVYTAG